MKPGPACAEGPRVFVEQAVAFRLRRHHLAERSTPASLVRVAGDMCGVQAQIGSAAQLSLRARVRGLVPGDVERALWRDRTLVKAWCMRGTTHLLPAEDLAVFVRGCARRAPRSGRWMLRRGLAPEAMDAIIEAIADALEAGPLTRRELGDRVARVMGSRVRPFVEHSWGGVVQQACLRGVACFGPDRGNEVTFARPDTWLPGWRDRPVAEAESELLRRYLRAHGPARVADFAGWADMAIGDARPIWERVEGELAPVSIEGRIAWVLRADLPVLRKAKITGPLVRLLPSFDVFLLGHRDKGRIVDAAHYKRVYRKAGWLSPVVLVDGRAAGVWSQVRRGRRILLKMEPFGPFSRAVRAGIESEAEDIGRFLGASCEVTLP